MLPETARLLWSFFIALFLSAFAMNWLWEMTQMRAYTEMERVQWWDTVLTCTMATLGDVVITLAIYAVGALSAAELRWGTAGGWNVYATGALLGGACAVSFEWYARWSLRWSYTERMPIVPLLGVGLWPLVQLTLLVPAAFCIAGWWTKQR